MHDYRLKNLREHLECECTFLLIILYNFYVDRYKNETRLNLTKCKIAIAQMNIGKMALTVHFIMWEG